MKEESSLPLPIYIFFQYIDTYRAHSLFNKQDILFQYGAVLRLDTNHAFSFSIISTRKRLQRKRIPLLLRYQVSLRHSLGGFPKASPLYTQLLVHVLCSLFCAIWYPALPLAQLITQERASNYSPLPQRAGLSRKRVPGLVTSSRPVLKPLVNSALR